MGKFSKACQWSCSINGKELDSLRKSSISSITINEICDGSDTATIMINDPAFLFIEDNIFVEDVPVSIKMWWVGNTSDSVSFDGYISAIDPNFPEEGIPTLQIYCLDGTHLMNRSKKTRSWDNLTRADVVRKVAAEYGFDCCIEEGYNFRVQETISQSKQTDIEFLEDLASQETDIFICKLVGKTIHFVKKGKMSEPSVSIFYRKAGFELRSFSPKINKETRQEEVTSSNISDGDKSDDTSTVSSGTSSSTSEEESPKTTSDPTTTTSEKQVKYNPVTREWEAE